jgi:hypothetical protein
MKKRKNAEKRKKAEKTSKSGIFPQKAEEMATLYRTKNDNQYIYIYTERAEAKQLYIHSKNLLSREHHTFHQNEWTIQIYIYRRAFLEHSLD